VLLGHDHEYSETYFAEAAAYFGEPETDLLAGAPDWWTPPVRAAATPDQWVGFVYGFDGAAWWRAPYDVADGFTSLGLPAVDDERYRELAVQFVEDAPERARRPRGGSGRSEARTAATSHSTRTRRTDDRLCDDDTTRAESRSRRENACSQYTSRTYRFSRRMVAT
jgi:hypothetical protein